MVSSFSSCFSTPSRALRTASTCLRNCWARSSMRSSVISSSLKITSSRMVRSPALERVAHADHRLGDRRHARDRLDHRQLAALDAAGDFDFAFAREQRHGAHLAQVHADGVVGLVERARREVQLGAFAFGPFLPVDAFAFELVTLFRVDQVDAGAREHREQLFEVFGIGREIGGQQVVHFVVEEVSLLFADDDQLPDFIELVFERQGHIACDLLPRMNADPYGSETFALIPRGTSLL